MQTLRMRVLVMFVLVAVAGTVGAQTSVGVMLGEPTGLSGKRWLNNEQAVDVALAWSFIDVDRDEGYAGSLYFHADYQYHFDYFDIDVGRLPLYAGLGAKIYVSSGFAAGIRIPLGAVYEFEELPLELFVELAPGINILPASTPDTGGGLGIRYRF